MIYIEPIDPAEFILAADRSRQEILARNFAEISLAEATKLEILDPKYEPIGFMKGLQDEFYDTLMAIWSRDRYSRRKFSEAYTLPPFDIAGDLDAIQKAYKSASRRSLWEKITKTNHKDIQEYKELLRQYSENLLNAMQDNFGAALFKNR